MKIPDNIFLIGPMGAGKTTIGRHLASALKKEFRDSDKEIEKRTGADIPLIFELEGEEGFRRREREMIDELSALHDLVLATGGGVVLDPQNRNYLMGRGLVIYLQASINQLMERTRYDRNRPLLQTDDPRARLEAIMETREPLYLECAEMVVDTGGRGVQSVVQEILQRIDES